jgi:peptide/nickel transport system ATP-binding protein
MLEAKNIKKNYLNRAINKTFTVLDDCSLKLYDNKVYGLMGKSGCGKSTFAKILLGLSSFDGGQIFYNGKDIAQFNAKQKCIFREKVQFVSQTPASFFDPKMKLSASMCEPFRILKLAIDSERINELLEIVSLPLNVLNRYPYQLSGGELQRLSICRALLLEPETLVFDEPTSMLDISVQAEILHMLKKLRTINEITYLLISHDRRILEWMECEIFILMNGRVERDV